MKRELRARSDQEVKTACSTILLKLAANGLQNVFEKWVERCKKCIACQGMYFGKDTITALPQSSMSPRTFQTAFTDGNIMNCGVESRKIRRYRTAGNLTDIRTLHLPNTILKPTVAIQGAILQEFCALYTKLPQW
jgi:hypothetical protein